MKKMYHNIYSLQKKNKIMTIKKEIPIPIGKNINSCRRAKFQLFLAIFYLAYPWTPLTTSKSKLPALYRCLYVPQLYHCRRYIVDLRLVYNFLCACAVNDCLQWLSAFWIVYHKIYLWLHCLFLYSVGRSSKNAHTPTIIPNSS